MQRLPIIAALLGLALAAPPLVTAGDGATFDTAKLLTHHQPERLRVSPDGDRLLVTTRQADMDANRYVKRHWIVSLAENGEARILDLPARARSPAWLDDDELAFLAPAGERGMQVWRRPVQGGGKSRLTAARGNVRDFRVAPGADRLAYRVAGRPAPGPRPGNGAGVEIDMNSFRAARLTRDRLQSPPRPSTRLEVAALDGSEPRRVAADRAVRDYRWSPDGERLAIVASPDGERRNLRSDLLLFTPGTGELETLAKGSNGQNGGFTGAVSHAGPTWGPGSRRLAYFRTDHSDRWSSSPALLVHEQASGETRELLAAGDEAFSASRLHWRSPGRLLAELTRRGRHGLFAIETGDGAIEPVRLPDHRTARFRFAAEAGRSAWVASAADRPPEVHTAAKPGGAPKQVTHFNAGAGHSPAVNVTQRHWSSSDVTRVQGWLLRPKDAEPGRALPTVTILHGGPGVPVTNHFRYDPGNWVHPVQTLVARGMAVFLPNYRGTDSFGRDFQRFDAVDGAAVQDVLTGIDDLVNAGLADPERLGIAGYSHGAWLAPLVAEERAVFRAAVLAEGPSNLLSLYGQTSAWRNRNIHRHYTGVSALEDPRRYLALSPAFLDAYTANTPSLLLYGEHASAIQGTELASALNEKDTDHEMVVYPGAGHALRKPVQQLDAMKRTVEWFEERLLERQG